MIEKQHFWTVLFLLFLLLFSCSDIKNKLKLSITDDIETKENKESIRVNIYDFIEKNKKEKIINVFLKIVNNHRKYIITNNDSIYGAFDKNSINVGVNLNRVLVSPIATSYNIVEGKTFEYNIFDNEYRLLQSYILNFEIDKENNIKNCWLYINFFSDEKGVNSNKLKLEDNISLVENKIIF